jgi:hypothetical protein
MSPAFLFITLVAVARPMSDIDVQQRYMRIHHVWQDLHAAGAKEQKSISAFLVFDPRQSEMWVESDGKIDETSVESLPNGFEWSAYVVTTRGVSSIPFPVRLCDPHRNSEEDNDTEQIWIIGAKKNRHWHFTISGTKSSHMCNIGSGSGASSYKMQLPDIDACQPEDGITASILDPETPRERKWSENIRTEWYSFEILRTKTP